MRVGETWIAYKISIEYSGELSEYFTNFKVGDKIKILGFDDFTIIIKFIEKDSDSEKWDKSYFLKHFKKSY